MPEIDCCRGCGGTNLDSVMDFGHQPHAGHFLTERQVGTELQYPLNLLVCMDCTVPQLSFTVPAADMWTQHTYLSGTNSTLGKHFVYVLDRVNRAFCGSLKTPKMLDLGSNDGTFLVEAKGLGFTILGVDPCRAAADAAGERGIPNLCYFFTRDLGRQIAEQYGKYDVVHCSGVYFHLEDLDDFTAGVTEVLADDGVFVVEFTPADNILRHWDIIYHEHYYFWTPYTLAQYLRQFSLYPALQFTGQVHGGTCVMAFSRNGDQEPLRPDSVASYYELERLVMRDVNAFWDDRRILRALDHDSIWGIGAPVKGNTFLNTVGADSTHVKLLLETNELRRGMFAPGSHIPLKMHDEVTGEPEVALVLAWNLYDQIRKRYHTWDSEIICPVGMVR